MIAVLALTAGCRSDSRAAACREDRSRLDQVIAIDHRADQQLHATDLAASKGDAKAALAALAQASPLVDTALQQVRGWTPKTRWGMLRHDAVLNLIELRRRSLVDYEQALRSDDLQRVIDQLAMQQAIESKAIDLEREAGEPASLEKGECDPN